MAADQRGVRVSSGEFRQVHRCGFTGQVAGDLEPGVLKHDGFQFGRAFDDRIEFRGVAMLRDPELDAHHRAIAHAAIEFVEAGLRVIRIEIDESECALGKMADGAQHVVVLPAHPFRGRIVTPLHAHEEAQPRDAQAVRVFEQFAEARLRSVPRHAVQMAVQVPDFHARWPGETLIR